MERLIVIEDFAFDGRYLHSLGLQRLKREGEKGPGSVYLTLLLFTGSGMDRTNWRSNLGGDKGTVEAYLNVVSAFSPETPMDEIAEAVTRTWLNPPPEPLVKDSGQQTDKATDNSG